MAGQQVIVSVLADTRRFNSAMAGTDRVLTRFQTSLRNVNRVGVLAFTSLAYAASRFTISAVKAAEEAEAIDRKLVNQARNIKTLGDNYKAVSDRLIALAEVQQKLIGVDDDLIKSTQTLLLTFPDLAKTADKAGGAFDRATIAAFNLAELGIGTAETNAIQLGKALEDPVKGLTSLTRSGITFSKAQKEQIKNWANSGQKAKAYSYILGVIETQTADAGVVGVTATQKLSTAWDNLQEVFGSKLLPKLTPIIEELTTVLYDLSQSEDFDVFVQAFADAIKQLAKDLPVLVRELGKLLKLMNKNNVSLIDAAIGFGILSTALKLLSSNLVGSYFGALLAASKRNKQWANAMRDADYALGEIGATQAFHKKELQKLIKVQDSGKTMTKKQTDAIKYHRDELHKANAGVSRWTKTWENLNGQMAAAGKTIDDLTGKVTNTTSAWSKVVAIFEKLPKGLLGALKLLGRLSLILTIIEASFYLLKGAFQGFTDYWNKWAEENPETVKKLEELGISVEGLTTLFGYLGKALEFINWLFELLYGLLEGIGNFIGTVLAVILTDLLETITYIVDGLKWITGWGGSDTEIKMPSKTYINPSSTPSTTPNIGNNMSPVTINVQSLVPTAETGRVVAKSFNEYRRTGGRL